MVNPETAPHYRNFLAAFESAAPVFKVEPITSMVRSTGDIEGAVEALGK